MRLSIEKKRIECWFVNKETHELDCSVIMDDLTFAEAVEYMDIMYANHFGWCDTKENSVMEYNSFDHVITERVNGIIRAKFVLDTYDVNLD